MRMVPEVRVSSPARQCSSVDLPEPDGPIMAVNRPASKADRHPVEGVDGGIAGAVDPGGIDGAGHDPGGRCRW